jgi:hypothetical protein
MSNPNPSTNDSEFDDGVNPNAHLYPEFARIDEYFSRIASILMVDTELIQIDGGHENFLLPLFEDDSDDDSIPSLVSDSELDCCHKECVADE